MDSEEVDAEQAPEPVVNKSILWTGITGMLVICVCYFFWVFIFPSIIDHAIRAFLPHNHQVCANSYNYNYNHYKDCTDGR